MQFPAEDLGFGYDEGAKGPRTPPRWTKDAGVAGAAAPTHPPNALVVGARVPHAWLTVLESSGGAPANICGAVSTLDVLHPTAIREPGEIRALLRRVRDRRVSLTRGMNRRIEREVARLDRCDEAGIQLRTENKLRPSSSPIPTSSSSSSSNDGLIQKEAMAFTRL